MVHASQPLVRRPRQGLIEDDAVGSRRIVIDSAGDLLLILQKPGPSSDNKPKHDQQASDDDTKRHEAALPGIHHVKPWERTTQTVELLVNSAALSVASPVFKAMLQGPFAEAAGVTSAKASGKPYRLPLPEDDLHAAAAFCRLAHHQALEAEPPGRSARQAARMEQLAFFCDKYQCAGVLRYQGEAMVREWLEHRQRRGFTAEEVCRVFVFAYVADLACVFPEVAWKLLLLNKGPIDGPDSEAKPLRSHPLVPFRVVVSLDRKRQRICELYHKAMLAPITTTEWGSLGRGCGRANDAVGKYLRQLGRAGILTRETGYPNHSLGELVTLSFWPEAEVGPCLRGQAAANSPDHDTPAWTDSDGRRPGAEHRQRRCCSCRRDSREPLQAALRAYVEGLPR